MKIVRSRQTKAQWNRNQGLQIMKTALIQTIQFILSGNERPAKIINMALQMSLASSLMALLFGVPFGAFLAMASFRGKKILIVLNRTLMEAKPRRFIEFYGV